MDPKKTALPRRWAAALLLVLWLCAAFGCGPAERADLPLGDRIRNCGEVVAAIRAGLRQHASAITVTFDYGSDIFSELNGVIDLWVDEALAETDDPTEGDYIRYQYGGYTYESSYVIEDGRWRYTVKLTPNYYTFLSQEEQVTEAVAEILRDLSFGRRTGEPEKIRAIYAYLCENVTYDKIHRKNPYYHRCSTAYAALVQKTATCQGYCAALYRLLRESGIDCRIVTGYADREDGAELHAWVIAAVDGLYYNLDPTWDAGNEEYRYFLLGADEFADHIRGDDFLTDIFLESYPMAEYSYNLSE